MPYPCSDCCPTCILWEGVDVDDYTVRTGGPISNDLAGEMEISPDTIATRGAAITAGDAWRIAAQFAGTGLGARVIGEWNDSGGPSASAGYVSAEVVSDGGGNVSLNIRQHGTLIHSEPATLPASGSNPTLVLCRLPSGQIVASFNGTYAMPFPVPTAQTGQTGIGATNEAQPNAMAATRTIDNTDPACPDCLPIGACTGCIGGTQIPYQLAELADSDFVSTPTAVIPDIGSLNCYENQEPYPLIDASGCGSFNPGLNVRIRFDYSIANNQTTTTIGVILQDAGTGFPIPGGTTSWTIITTGKVDCSSLNYALAVIDSSNPSLAFGTCDLSDATLYVYSP